MTHYFADILVNGNTGNPRLETVRVGTNDKSEILRAFAYVHDIPAESITIVSVREAAPRFQVADNRVMYDGRMVRVTARLFSGLDNAWVYNLIDTNSGVEYAAVPENSLRVVV